jgi:translation elongation factor P/translation initiation factor 5A
MAFDFLNGVYDKGRQVLCRVLAAGTLVSSARTGVNFAVGDGVEITSADDSGNDRVNLTFKTSTTIPSARVYRSSNQSISDSTDTIVTFDSERYDTAALHSNVSNTGRLTAPIAGKYLITVGLEFASNTSGRREIRLLLNGSTIIAQDIRAGSISGITSPMTLTTVYALAQNDYVEVQVWQNRGGNLNVLSTGNHSPEFAMHWLMP